MSWYQDLDTHTMVASGDHVRAIGWLAGDQPFQQGDVPPGFLARLDEFVRLVGRSAEALSFPAFGGLHECELCDRPADPHALGPCGCGNLGVPDGLALFVAPELVAHYVRVHSYQPPAQFLAALMAAPLPDTPEYRAMAEPFARPTGRSGSGRSSGRSTTRVGGPESTGGLTRPSGRQSARSAACGHQRCSRGSIRPCGPPNHSQVHSP